MSDNGINWFITILSLILLAVSIWTFGCGQNQAFQPISEGSKYYIPVGTDERIIPVIAMAVYIWNENYGICPHKVNIVPRKWGFDCDGVLAAGCQDGGVIEVGINHTSTCQTIKVILHELYHSCKYIYTHDESWQYPMQMLIYQTQNSELCIEGISELYDPYSWN